MPRRGRRRAVRPSEEELAARNEERRKSRESVRAPAPSPAERAEREEARRKNRESVRAPRPPWATYWCKAQDGPAPVKEIKQDQPVVRADFVKGARRG